jgi:hypothetical protein
MTIWIRVRGFCVRMMMELRMAWMCEASRLDSIPVAAMRTSYDHSGEYSTCDTSVRANRDLERGFGSLLSCETDFDGPGNRG